MRRSSAQVWHIPTVILTILVTVRVATVAGAQSQEPKPVHPATPVSETEIARPDSATTGVSDSAWEGPNSGMRISWDPAVWTVEGEAIEDGYDGLQIGTPISTVYLEAYEGFGGDAEACFADAEQELSEREGISEVVPLTGRQLPVADDDRGEAGLFGVTAELPDGTTYRGVEYIECRTVVPGESVLEITWQAVTQAFNQDFPAVEALFAAIEMPEQSSQDATPVVPRATPVS